MCGVVGIFSLKELSDNAINPMIKSLHHRGPDASNYLYNQSKNVLFGHTRLAIIDLSDAGAQPMKSISQRYIISFNGEIYNFEQLKSSLIKIKPDIRFRGKSDTEVLVNYIEMFGVDKTLKDIEGMFAFALWDEKEKTLVLARDRAGEKPLYYGYHKGCLYFSSELKAIQSKFVDLEICHDSIRLLLKYNCIPAPKTIYKNFYKVEPASYVKFKNPDDQPLNIRYFTFSKNQEDFVTSNDGEVVNSFENLLKKAVKSQMVADVPLGAFLSGGIDSSLIAALMQENSSNPIKTYSIGFNNESYNEAPFSKKISEVIGSDHYELYVDDSDMINLINELPNIYCEPFSDSSQIPTYFVSKFASESVKVALTGDAGDEMFGGYNRYLFAHKYFNNINSLPRFSRKLISKFISSIPSNNITSLGSFLFKVLNKKVPSDFGGKAHKFSTAMVADDLNQLHDINTTHWNENSKIYKSSDFNMPHLYRKNAGSISNVNDMLKADFYGYLHDDNLCKVDRAAMAVSLETRVPFLDKNIINFAANLPFKFKIRDNETKWILKQTLYKKIPKSHFDRPKAGFAIPINEWMRSSLKEMIDHLIFDLNLEDSEVINYQEVKKIWKSFLEGDNSYTYHIWDIIMLKAWLERH
tara:strand:- start:16356 stop:18269 length:1914 start_codon:yes stop_codon:yes gene_type:complete